jgi:alpha-D-xyloside xylohydrolase
MRTIRWLLVCSVLMWMVRCEKPMTTIPVVNGIQMNGPDLHVRIQFYDEHIVRVIKWPAHGTPDKLSLSVIQDSLPELNILVEPSADGVTLKSPDLTVIVSRSTGAIQYYTDNQELKLSELGSPEFSPMSAPFESSFHIRQKFLLTAQEGLYGLGQHQDGTMNYRHKEVVLVQSNTDAVTPFLISTRNYGIFWDNYSKTVFRGTDEGAEFWSDVGDAIDYYFISGATMDGVIGGYRALTGQAPLYGKWAYGYWQSKEHYENREELMSVAKEYRRRQIPIDNMIQDWDYWNGPENWGGMFFDQTLFPKPEQMIDELHRMHFHLMISIWPALGPNTPVYKDMLSHGYLYAPVGWAGFKYYDAFNPDANQLYWQYLKDGLYSKGVDAWWIDSTEPDVVNALTKDATEYEMKKVGRNYLGSWARTLNAFSLKMTDALYKNLRKESENQRVYILTRSTFAGQQRDAATTWSGDIGANWDIYKNQISAGLNHCMSGIPYWTFDIGAFVIGAYGGVFMNGGKDPAYQELYTRMFQFGTFSPVFRSHGSETPREIWEMGEFVPVLIQFDHLRYRLMPYIYSLAWKITHDGYTMMRGLPMDFPHDRDTYSIGDQYMFGPALMVCPVTRFMKYRPPESSILVGSQFFRTAEGKPGLKASYYTDAGYRHLSLEKIDPDVDIIWYTGRPSYVTDSTYAIRWEGTLIPPETGPYQFHIKCFDSYRIKIDGRELNLVYRSTEGYTEMTNLNAGQSYSLAVEVENRSTGAARMRLFWKTPAIFAREKSELKAEKVRSVYLPKDTEWINFWTGQRLKGGQNISADAPIEICPLFVRAGALVPMGPFIQYASEKPADPLELRIYSGADGSFILYEDENDNYHYEQGIYTTIAFQWDDAEKTLTIGSREGNFPGMLTERAFRIVLVRENHGTGIAAESIPDRVIRYDGKRKVVRF